MCHIDSPDWRIYQLVFKKSIAKRKRGNLFLAYPSFQALALPHSRIGNAESPRYDIL